MPSPRRFPLLFGIYTRLTGRACQGCADRWISVTSLALAWGVNATSPSMPAVARPAFRSVTCRTLNNVFARLRSINFCKFRTCLRSPTCDAVKILCRRRRTCPSTARQLDSAPLGGFVLRSVHSEVRHRYRENECRHRVQLALRFRRPCCRFFTSSPGPRQHPFRSGHVVPYPASYPGHQPERVSCRPGFLLPFDHRHSLLGPSVPAKASVVLADDLPTIHIGRLDLVGVTTFR